MFRLTVIGHHTSASKDPVRVDGGSVGDTADVKGVNGVGADDTLGDNEECIQII